MSKKKVQIRLNGDSAQQYKIKKDGNWLDGGTIIEVTEEEAQDLVRQKRIAHFPDGEKATVKQEKAPQTSGDMKFDQDSASE